MEITSEDDDILTSNKTTDIDCWLLDIDKQEYGFELPERGEAFQGRNPAETEESGAG